jgi:hypothetical protein
VYLGLASFALIVLEALTMSIVDIPGTFSKISTVLSTLFYTAIAAFIFGISIVSVAVNKLESQFEILPHFGFIFCGWLEPYTYKHVSKLALLIVYKLWMYGIL